MYDVFISYHGGSGDESRSSYPKAEELYEYLTQRNVKCFLCKKRNCNDFYDEISKGLMSSRHFILVACDKNCLSEWVKDEVKTFDGLRKNGEKPHCLISAYLFGNITLNDLYNFNPLFATKDIVGGADGFERLYNMILQKDSEGAKSGDGAKKAYASADDVSIGFLAKGLRRYRDMSDDEIESQYNLVAKRLACMQKRIEDDKFIENLFCKVCDCDDDYILKIAGQPGTQKSFILQLLYVALRRNQSRHDFEPIYLHLGEMKKLIERKYFDADSYLVSVFEEHDLFGDKTPLFIVDGVQNIVVDDLKLDYAIKKYIDKYGASVILGENLVFEDNQYRLNKSPFFRKKYAYSVDLSPVSLYDYDKCLTYLSTLKIDREPEEMFDVLKKAGLLTIDEETVKVVCENYDERTNSNITDIYETVICDLLDGDVGALSKGAEIAFEYAYKTTEINFDDALVKKILDLVLRGRIYVNCLIALYFLRRLDRYEDEKDMTFMDIILPKEVTRFVVFRLNAYPRYEKSVVEIGRRYSELASYGKSEITYFLGRIKNEKDRYEAIDLLKKYYSETKEEIRTKVFDEKYNGVKYPYRNRKEDLFLLRGIAVSLIYFGDKAVLEEYIESLINNDLCNMINRGFHLEYYGDKRYVPNQNTLDYEDDNVSGERTLRILLSSLESGLKRGKLNSSAMLDMFTAISLIQIRMQYGAKANFDLHAATVKTLKVAKQYVGDVQISNRVIKTFFEMAIEDIERYLASGEGEFRPEVDLVNCYSEAHTVKRAGWVMQNVPVPESIAEHMYGCWFLAMVMLPEEIAQHEEYDKNKVLRMLLVHDLAETKLDDIPKYEKPSHIGYEQLEDKEMLKIFLKETYDNVDTMQPYLDAWNEWYEQESINALVAKDIDTLQAVYQFAKYLVKYPDNFDEKRRANWFAELDCLKTSVVRNIAKRIVVNNPAFADYITKYISD